MSFITEVSISSEAQNSGFWGYHLIPFVPYADTITLLDLLLKRKSQKLRNTAKISMYDLMHYMCYIWSLHTICATYHMYHMCYIPYVPYVLHMEPSWCLILVFVLKYSTLDSLSLVIYIQLTNL